MKLGTTLKLNQIPTTEMTVKWERTKLSPFRSLQHRVVLGRLQRLASRGDLDSTHGSLQPPVIKSPETDSDHLCMDRLATEIPKLEIKAPGELADYKLSMADITNIGAIKIISTPREYQLEVFELAKQMNVLAVLDTGKFTLELTRKIVLIMSKVRERR